MLAVNTGLVEAGGASGKLGDQDRRHCFQVCFQRFGGGEGFEHTGGITVAQALFDRQVQLFGPG